MEYTEHEKANAPLMVFLHGGGVSGWMWDEQIKYFSQNYHCIVPDLPGHGLSRQKSFSINECAENIIKIIKEKKSDQPVIVIGFSLGAQILVKILSLTPNLIDYAIINSALIKPMKFSMALLRPIFKLSFPLVKMKSFAKLQSKVLYINENQFERYYQESKEISFESFMEVMEENMSFGIPEGYSKSTSRILITVGQKEKKIMRESATELMHNNPNSSGIIIPNVGHGIPLADPNYFNHMIENWIAKGSLPNNAIKISIQK